MNESNESDVTFLKSRLLSLQNDYAILGELSDSDLSTPDGPPETSGDNQRCARLAESHGFDGNVFWNLFPASRVV